MGMHARREGHAASQPISYSGVYPAYHPSLAQAGTSASETGPPSNNNNVPWRLTDL